MKSHRLQAFCDNKRTEKPIHCESIKSMTETDCRSALLTKGSFRLSELKQPSPLCQRGTFTPRDFLKRKNTPSEEGIGSEFFSEGPPERAFGHSNCNSALILFRL